MVAREACGVRGWPRVALFRPETFFFVFFVFFAGVPLASLTTMQRGFSSEAAVTPKQEALYALKRNMWKQYFAQAKPEAPVSRGVQPTVSEAVDTTNFAFVDDPILGLFHRVTEMTAEDPFVKMYKEYLECRDPKREKELLAKIDALLPVEFTESKDEVLEKMRIPYLFLSEFEKQQKQ